MPNAFSTLRAVVMLLLMWLAAAPLSAADKNEPTNTKQTEAMSQAVFEKVQKANELASAKQYSQALTILSELQNGDGFKSYDYVQIWNLTAYIYYLQEKYPQAIRAYDKVLAQTKVPEGIRQSTLKTQAQLYFTIEDYKSALATANKLLAAVAEPSPDIYMLVGQAHFQLKQYKQALTPIRKGIDIYKGQNKKPEENWLLLLRVCYHELKDYRNMLATLKELIRYYPKPKYVLTMAAVYSEMDDTKRQMVLTEALYESGYLADDPRQAVNLASLYMLHGVPYKAAKLLDKEIDANRVESNERHLVLLSQAWYQAREDAKSIPPLRRAAELSGKGELYVRLAQSYVNLEEWSKAADALRDGLKRGGIRRPDQAQIMLGMSLFNEKRLSDARSAFAKASKDKRSAKVARQWLAYIDTELRRQETMDQVLPDRPTRKQDAILRELQETVPDSLPQSS